MEVLAAFLVDIVHRFGYAGIFIMAFLESTFLPIPSEATLIPAGYLVHQGVMSGWLVWIVATAGAVGGALLNYFIAYYYGRRFLYAYGKYLFFSHEKMEKLDHFFARHGEISTLTGRLVPGLRHFISFPAGLAHMDLKKFCTYTGVGGGLWMSILLLVGYVIGGNKDTVHRFMPYVTAACIAAVVLMISFYIWHQGKKKRMTGADNGQI